MGKLVQLDAYGETLGSLQAFYTQQQGCTDPRRKQRMVAALTKILEKELTPRQRQTARMYYFEGFTIPQIAGKLGVNKSTVSRNLQAARRRIATCMKYWAL